MYIFRCVSFIIFLSTALLHVSEILHSYILLRCVIFDDAFKEITLSYLMCSNSLCERLQRTRMAATSHLQSACYNFSVNIVIIRINRLFLSVSGLLVFAFVMWFENKPRILVALRVTDLQG